MADSPGIRDVKMTEYMQEDQTSPAHDPKSHEEGNARSKDIPMSAEENPGGESSGEHTSDERPSGKTDADGHEPEFVDHKTERDDSKGESNGIERSQNGSSFTTPSFSRHQDAAALTSPEKLRLDKDMARLRSVLSEVSPEAAQRVLREKWRTFIFDGYIEDHISFVARAALKNSNSSVLKRILKDDGIFKEPFQQVASRRPGIIEKVLRNVTPAQLIEYAPENVIDLLLAERIKNIQAIDLVRMLAEGERLGYKPDDILDESDESVVPNVRSQPTSQDDMSFEETGVIPNTNLVSSNRDALLAELERIKATFDPAKMLPASVQQKTFTAKDLSRFKPPTELICPSCKAQMPTLSGYNYHITKKPCEDGKVLDGRWNCYNCMTGFTGKQGLNYHQLRDVCKANSEPTSSETVPPLQQPQQGWPSGLNPAIRHTEELAKPYIPSRPTSGAILPPRPSMYTSPPSQPSVPSPTPIVLPRPTQVSAVQRPPLHTPNMPKQDSGIKYSPADLPPEKRAAMEKEIAEEEARFEQSVLEFPDDMTEQARNSKLVALKNAHATRKSVIRKRYNVSLRLRDDEKKARLEAGIIPRKPSLEKFRAHSQSSSGNATPAGPVSGFSPINTPNNRPSPVNNVAHSPPSTSQYHLPHTSVVSRVSNPMSQPHPEALAHALESVAGPSGFGVLKSQNPVPMTPTNYTYVQQTHKRRRTSVEPSPLSTGQNSPHFPLPHTVIRPGLSMMEVQADDAVSRYAKKAATKQNGNDSIQRPGSSSKDTPMTDGVTVVIKGGSGTKNSAYTIISSSDEENPARGGAADGGDHSTEARSSEEQILNADKVRRSVENDRAPGPRSGFKAKRGGKH